MPSDVRDLLRESAREPSVPVDVDAVRARGRRRQRVTAATTAAVTVLAVVSVVVAVDRLPRQPGPVAPYVEDAPPSAPSTEASPGTDDVAGLGGGPPVLAVAEDAPGGGRIRFRTPDGGESSLAVDTPTPSRVRWYPDGHGGIVWQDLDAPLVHHVAADGRTETILDGAAGEGRIDLVGIDHGRGGVLVQRTVGATPEDTTADLLRVTPADGAPPERLVADIAGWESGVGEAVAAPTGAVLYGLGAEGSVFAMVRTPGADPVTVFEGGESNGEYVAGVALIDAGEGVVLIEHAAGFPDHPTGRLLRVDLAAGRVTAEVEVPLQLGIGDTWAVPRDVSVAGGRLLVNRDAEGTWLEPLLLDLDTGEWSAGDLPGRSRLVASAPGETDGTTAAGPSQRPEDAVRDGVVPAVAALGFDARVNLVAPATPSASTRVETDEGVWVVSQPTLADGESCLGDRSGRFGRDYVCIEYGEVLLLDAAERVILRAFPFPFGVPRALLATDDAVYCARQGDGAVPDSSLCRLDRDTLTATVRVYPSSNDHGLREPNVEIPAGWTIAAPVREPLFEDLLRVGDRLISVGQEQLTPVDPVTLELLDPATLDASRAFGSIRAVDPEGPSVTIDPAEWLSGEAARAAYEEETGHPSGPPDDYLVHNPDWETVTLAVAEQVQVTMTLIWDDASGPEDVSEAIGWTEFARFWGDDGADVYPYQAVELARASYYHLIVVDGEVVRVEQQYQP